MRLLHLCTAVLFSALSACSSFATHEVTLLAPISEPCNKVADPGCQPTYFSCADLSVTELRLAVGVFDRQVTTVPCPDNLQQTGNAAVQVSYQPGANFYMIDASYSRNMEKQNLTAGPFLESDREWRIVLK